jgi:hypothetical protein
VRTTVDLPDALFRRAKATAAVRGTSLKDLMIQAIERETQPAGPVPPAKRRAFPLVHLKHKKTLDLAGFNFDDILP